jgi:hypothetical protein
VLLQAGLAEEVLLLVFPVLLGKGKRFMSDNAVPRELSLVGTKATSSGVLINTYRNVGALRTGSFADPPAKPTHETAKDGPKRMSDVTVEGGI